MKDFSTFSNEVQVIQEQLILRDEQYYYIEKHLSENLSGNSEFVKMLSKRSTDDKWLDDRLAELALEQKRLGQEVLKQPGRLAEYVKRNDKICDMILTIHKRKSQLSSKSSDLKTSRVYT